MMERCFVKVQFDPGTSGGQVRRAVGGFLRYIQHRDLHLAAKVVHPTPDVAGLVKYVAYRDKASGRAELFGPEGRSGAKERKEFASFVARSIDSSEPQLFKTSAGLPMDRRRAVSRFLISPESAQGLDLERLARAAVSRLETEMGVSDLRWIAAIHRNTAHHHVHLVLAGMRQDAAGAYRRVDISKPRLAAMKEAIGLESERQRRELTLTKPIESSEASGLVGRDSKTIPALQLPAVRPALIRALPPTRLRQASSGVKTAHAIGSVLALRAVARRYQRQMERELAQSYRQSHWELVA